MAPTTTTAPRTDLRILIRNLNAQVLPFPRCPPTIWTNIRPCENSNKEEAEKTWPNTCFDWNICNDHLCALPSIIKIGFSHSITSLTVCLPPSSPLQDPHFHIKWLEAPAPPPFNYNHVHHFTRISPLVITIIINTAPICTHVVKSIHFASTVHVWNCLFAHTINPMFPSW